MPVEIANVVPQFGELPDTSAQGVDLTIGNISLQASALSHGGGHLRRTKKSVSITKVASSSTSAREVEARLVRHYLHTDGPSGAGPLTYIDASREELGEALHTEPTSAVQTLLAACGGEDGVAHALAYGPSGIWPDSGAPGFFRFLVLTCAVVATADENPLTQDFGQNLQRLFGTGRVFAQRAALPGMWGRLVIWCDEKRKAGMPLRRIVLPPRGQGEHIGMTNAVSFPNWRDVMHLRGDFERNRHLARQIRKPDDAARVLDRRITLGAGYRSQMVDASKEFADLYFGSASLLGLHRFWTVVCRSLARTRVRQQERGSTRAELLLGISPRDAMISVTTFERDGTEKSGSESGLHCHVDEAIVQLAAWTKRQGVVDYLLARLKFGAVSFFEERFGVWILDDRQPSPSDRVVLLVADSRLPRVSHLTAVRKSLASPHWWIVGPIDGNVAAVAMRSLGMSFDTEVWAPLVIDGGVRTRSGWLGRPSILPSLYREGKGRLKVVSVPEGRKAVRLDERQPGRIMLACEDPLEGRYQFRLEDAVGQTSLAVEKTVRFCSDAPEHNELGHPGSEWAAAIECRQEALEDVDLAFDAAILSPRRARWGGLSNRYDDFLEVVYARGRVGLAESDFVRLANDLLPGPSPWDILRSLQESGWLLCTTSVKWKAKKWWLVEPHLLPFVAGDASAVLLCGSAPAVVRRRFFETTRARGGEVGVHPGVGPFSPSTCVAVGVDAQALSAELGWELRSVRLAKSLAAPACWPVCDADPKQHGVSREWDWIQGRFIDLTDGPARLTWHQRAEGDRQDIFTVSSAPSGDRFHTTVRALAVAEAYRQLGKPMFLKRTTDVVRLTAEGHLPLHLARTLHLTSLESSGPVLEGNVWRYVYSAEAVALGLVRECLGEGFIEGLQRSEAIGGRPLQSLSFGFARHRGRADRHIARTK